MTLQDGSNFNAQDVKKVKIYNLLSGYWQLAEKLDREFLGNYLAAVDECSAEAVALVCQRIASGSAGLNSSFPPTPADIAERARLLDAGKSKPVELFNGLIEMDFGHGRVDMRGLDAPEQDFIIRNHGMINGKNAALMDLETKRTALRALPAPESDKTVPMPKLQRI